ncbi:MAG: hypothetical protein ACRC0G_07530 [Fusobacteriaceae bacterium]
MEKIVGNINNIQCLAENKNLLLSSLNSPYVTTYFQTKESMYDLENYVKFIKKIESLVRRHPDYKRYIALLLDKGLGNCAVLGNIHKDDAEVEMHHGPILTLYDICTILTDHLIRVQGNCSSFEVAELVLEEHFKNRIQIVFLSETAHQLTHANNTFISLRQAYGNLNSFIQEYREDITQTQVSVINRYIEISDVNDTDYSELLKLRETVKTFN